MCTLCLLSFPHSFLIMCTSCLLSFPYPLISMWTLPTASSLAGFSSSAAHTLPSATALPSLLPLRHSRSQPTFPAACHLLKLIKSQNTFTSPTLSFLLKALWPPYPTLTQSLRILDFLNYWYHSVPFLKLNSQFLLVLCASQ